MNKSIDTRLLKFALLAVAFLMLVSVGTADAQQRFFNLTAAEVKIDSQLPRFTCSFPLPKNYADSIYTVSLRYPEFIKLTQSDVARYQQLSGKPLPALPRLEQRVVVSRKQGSLEVSFCPLVFRQGKHEVLVSFMLNVEARQRRRSVRRALARTRAEASSDRYAAHSVLATGRWAKISVPASGVYQLTEALIREAGFSDLSRVKVYGYGGNLQPEKLDGDYLKRTDDLQEVPTCTVNGRRLFYARGPVSWESPTSTRRIRNPYSDVGCYFITESDAQPLSIDSTEFLHSFYPSADDYHVLHEVDNYSWYKGGRNLFENDPINLGSSKSYTLNVPDGVTRGQLSVAVSAGSATSVDVALNDSLLSSMDITVGSYDKGGLNSRDYEVDFLQPENTVTITTREGGPARLDYLALTFATPKAAPDLKRASFPVPDYVYNIVNQDHHADPTADMVIIIPTSQRLLAQAQRLKTFHEEHDSLRVNIVPADELYNEFSSGTADANAYRRYLKMLYDRASTERDIPRYLLLFGDGVWDNRLLTPECRTLRADDLLLCFESENSFSELDCYVDDGFFGLLDDGEGANPQMTDKLDLAIGRFPVTTEAEAKVLVDKTINYAHNKYAGAWQNTIVFMGDDGNENVHMRDIDAAAEQVARAHPGYLIRKVMWDAYTRQSSATGNSYPEVTDLIKQYQSQGALIMDYGGHGKADEISHEGVLWLSDFANFRNQNLPLWITASCDIMAFDGVEPTIGEAAVLNEKGGAVAFFGTTRTVITTYNRMINLSFLRHVLTLQDGKPVTIGEAQRLAKNEMIASGSDLTNNKLQYSLLGDPALALNLPTKQVIVDEINGQSTADKQHPIQLKAGSVVTLKGHIDQAEDFSGVVTATVRDSEELITCKLNDVVEAQSPFQYSDRTKTLYAGSDSVRGGQFSFTFAVPKDINYTNGSGLINLYAVNSAHTVEAHGANDGFLVGGSQIAGTDSIGPSIYCYLNSPSFVNGGDVNPTPYFVAEVQDEDGINATGNGVGHNLELMIDGERSRTYVLNDNFQYDFGSYTRGSTFYNIPELTPGYHKLKFRAWDVLNNSSTAELSFRVVRGLQPNVFSVDVTRNPATTTTTFIISHDRTGSNMDVELDVFDLSGRQLWTHSEHGVSTNGAFTYDWDLTTSSGSRLDTGVYLFRARIASDGSKTVSKAKKLIVLGNN